MKYTAVLSTTVIPLDGTYRVSTLPHGSQPDLSGIPHYCGHPDTAEIMESFGAVKAPTKLFPGLQVGEIALCVPIAQGKSTRAINGFTTPHQNVTLAELELREIERIE